MAWSASWSRWSNAMSRSTLRSTAWLLIVTSSSSTINPRLVEVRCVTAVTFRATQSETSAIQPAFWRCVMQQSGFPKAGRNSGRSERHPGHWCRHRRHPGWRHRVDSVIRFQQRRRNKTARLDTELARGCVRMRAAAADGVEGCCRGDSQGHHDSGRPYVERNRLRPNPTVPDGEVLGVEPPDAGHVRYARTKRRSVAPNGRVAAAAESPPPARDSNSATTAAALGPDAQAARRDSTKLTVPSCGVVMSEMPA